MAAGRRQRIILDELLQTDLKPSGGCFLNVHSRFLFMGQMFWGVLSVWVNVWDGAPLQRDASPVPVSLARARLPDFMALIVFGLAAYE